jgi:purine nucleoside permease
MLALAVLTLLLGAAPSPPPEDTRPIAPAVLVITAFGEGPHGAVFGEAAPWVQHEHLTERIVPDALGRPIRCNATRRLCLLVSGEGKVNAATALLATGLSRNVDLRRTYVIVSGIAGAPPAMLTIGSAAWAEWIVDGDLTHQIDARALPAGFRFDRFRLGCAVPWCTQAWVNGDEVFRLDHGLVNRAYALSRRTPLIDDPAIVRYRRLYADTRHPAVARCDTMAGDTYWQGREASAFATWWTGKQTGGRGHYCTSEMEDAGFAAAQRQLARAGRARWDRFLVLRAASDFDQPHRGQTPLASLRALSAGLPVAIENAYRTAATVVRDLLARDHPE